MWILGVLIVGFLDHTAGFSGTPLRIPTKTEGNRATDDLIQTAFDDQNCYRAKSGVAPLTLDSQISQFSQNWANQLAMGSGGNLEHSGSSDYGENLFAAGYTFTDGGLPIRTWYREFIDNNYDFTVNDPQSSGHFTECVWNATTRVGFGVATGSDGWVYFVACYAPPGNYLGEFTANVFQPSDSNLDSCVPASATEDADTNLINVL